MGNQRLRFGAGASTLAASISGEERLGRVASQGYAHDRRPGCDGTADTGDCRMIRVKLPGLVVGLAIWCGIRSLCQVEPGCEPPVAARASMAAVEVPNALRAHFARRGEHKCAVAAFRVALRVGPHSAESRLDPGFGLIESGDLRDAVADLWKFSRRSPGFFQARTAYGTAHSLLGEHPAAVEEFAAARQLVTAVG